MQTSSSSSMRARAPSTPTAGDGACLKGGVPVGGRGGRGGGGRGSGHPSTQDQGYPCGEGAEGPENGQNITLIGSFYFPPPSAKSKWVRGQEEAAGVAAVPQAGRGGGRPCGCGATARDHTGPVGWVPSCCTILFCVFSRLEKMQKPPHKLSSSGRGVVGLLCFVSFCAVFCFQN